MIKALHLLRCFSFCSEREADESKVCRLSRISDTVSAKIFLKSRVVFGFRQLLSGRACTPEAKRVGCRTAAPLISLAVRQQLEG